MKFVGLTEEQELFAIEIMARAKVPISSRGKMLKKATMAIVKQQPFLMVCIKSGKKEFFGFAKQCTYAPAADEWNPERGVTIALARAVRNMCGGK